MIENFGLSPTIKSDNSTTVLANSKKSIQFKNPINPKLLYLRFLKFNDSDSVRHVKSKIIINIINRLKFNKIAIKLTQN